MTDAAMHAADQTRPSALRPARPQGRALRSFVAGAALALAFLTSGAAGPPIAVAAPDAPLSAIAAGTITVEVDKAQVLAVPDGTSAVFIANPEIADIQAHDPKRVLVFGKRPGSTTAYVFVHGGQLQRYTVTVKGASEDVAAAIKAQAPDADVQVVRSPGGLTVSGTAATPQEAEAVKSAAQQFLGDKDKLVFNVAVAGATQVNLQVRIAEVSRQASHAFGINWDAVFNNGTVAIGVLTGRQPASSFGNFIRSPAVNQLDSIGVGYKSGSFDVSGVIDALQSEGLATMLAEPNLTAVSGESANFLAGGEFPVPVSTGLDQVTVEWKKFGVSLDFTPTVLNGERISVKVRPEVSELSESGSVVLNNIKIPAITVRRAETTVELASGQSFAIAGLFQNTSTNSVKRYPWLGDLPVLGALFRSSSYQRNESELVIIVTPYIVRPAASPADLSLPTDSIVFSNDLERVLAGRLVAPAGAKTDRPHLSGPAGFMLEDKP